MGFLSGIFGNDSPWDGSHFIETITRNKFWHKGFIDKDEAISFGQRFAMEVDPMGARLRQQDVTTLIGELIFYFQTCENAGDFDAVRSIAAAMSKYIEKYPDQNAIVYFGAKTSYFSYT
jgi:hypothetical protein